MIKNTELTDSEIIELLENNSLGRNKYLMNFCKLLNGLDRNTIINLDGDWGSGKTVFCKQLEYLINNPEELKKNIKNIESDISDKFKVIYFNAWENDIFSNALQVFLVELLKKYNKNNEINEKDIAEVSKTVFNVLGKLVISVASGGLLSYDDIISEIDKNDVNIKDVADVSTIRDEIHKMIELLSGNKQLLIIVDELDRCRPNFAVDTLEVLKHFFNHEKVVFLVASNKKELSHTIKNYYGNDFDGYRYLNRLFDFEINLPLPDIEKYILYKYREQFENSDITLCSVITTCNYLNISLRDIGKYVTQLSTIMKVINKEKITSDDENNIIIFNYFIPYLVGLKLSNINDYNLFINGQGAELFSKFIMYNADLKNYFRNKIIKATSVPNLPLSIENKYLSYFGADKELSSVEKEALQDMYDILSMMSDYSNYNI